jgi:proteasome lid subunit RPN8/RPN11
MNVSGSHSGPHGGSSSSYSDIEARQQRIEEDIHNINASLTGFSDHFYGRTA